MILYLPPNISTIQRGIPNLALIIDIPLGVISLRHTKKHITLSSDCIDFNVELNKDKCFEFNSFHAYFESKLIELLPRIFA